MGLAVTLIGADTRRDRGLLSALPRILSAIHAQGVETASFQLGNVNVPSHYSDTVTEGLGPYSEFAAFRQSIRELPGASERYVHLLQHSDCDGFYLPIAFSKPLARIPGEGMFRRIVGESLSVCSSIHLLRELDALNETFRLPALTGDYSDEALEAIAESHPESPANIWCTLHWFAAQSVNGNVAIAFG